ncbi:hypothetical protein I79_011447 [Cricetulus griseus]|uniref:Uncharacterized protein n=1 Tax=Cricetulus griseus TaxID=10029 RepID=G3HL62_CRIGR|nr:hypothetical protein I79_011447 [Cricetulus griseus]
MADGFLHLRSAWSTERVPGQLGLLLHKETLSWKTNKQTNKQKDDRKDVMCCHMRMLNKKNNDGDILQLRRRR